MENNSDIFFDSLALTKAVRQLRAEGVNIKNLCKEVDDSYYNKLYDKMRKHGKVPLAFAEPIIERYPIFRNYLDGDFSRPAVQNEQAPGVRYADLERMEKKMDELMEETREYRRLLEQQMTTNAELQLQLVDLLKKNG
jgi:predicted ribosome quality control (RQC) complex YloA/Tae2 family protein